MTNKANILVVDDEQNITDSLKDILSDEGYKVDVTESGDDALAILQKQPYDLVLLDIWLPGRKDGLQTLREIQKRGINSEVIMISGHGSIDTAVRATKLGAFDFIEKPFSLDSMLETIKSALENIKKRDKRETALGGYRYVTASPEMKKVLKKMSSAAKSNQPILITGELGTGKEYTAMYIHRKSRRNADTFITVDCTGLKVSAFERLFGPSGENLAARGSLFTKLAGTIYLLNPQRLDEKLRDRLAKMIRASTKRQKKNLAFIASILTMPKSQKLTKIKKPLETLFSSEAIELPPLRERGQDILELIYYFIEHAAEDFGKPDLTVSKKAINRMVSYPWPGNVLELQTVVENMMMACTSNRVESEDIPFGGFLGKKPDTSKGFDAGAKIDTINKTAKSLRQKTIKHSVVATGLGLHSGIKTGIIISPLPPNSGIIFSDISTGKQVHAVLDNVESTEYATSLRFGQTSVKTIEHLMATLHMYGISNALIKVGDEIPIMDGSAVKFCELIESAKIVEQDEFLEPITLKEKIVEGELADDKSYIMVEPSDRLTIEYRMNYPQPVGKLRAKLGKNNLESFKMEIAPARTFGFIRDIKEFENRGFGEGGKLSNIILMDDEKIINTTLRFEDEFARHKILDILGDFYLLGAPVICKVTANLSGHSLNISILRKIRESFSNDVKKIRQDA